MFIIIIFNADITKETIKDIFALEKEIQKTIKKDNIREMRKRKYGHQRSVKKNTQRTEQADEVLAKPGNKMDDIQEEHDDFDLMDEPDIEIGVA